MSFKEDLKSILTELSPILAGFKLAVIIIGYFGLGSVAKWIISYWYPFTRWIWDQVSITLFLPEFPIIVKDSLTALMFFLPLGIVAVLHHLKGTNTGTSNHRFWGAVFGFIFLFVICKDTFGSIYEAISFKAHQSEGNNKSWLEVMGVLISFVILLTALYLLRKKALASPQTESSFFNVIRQFFEWINMSLDKNKLTILKVNVFVSLGFPIYTLSSAIGVANTDETIPIILASVIMFFILLSLLLSIFFSPKKLFITTGASIAFILAAMFFEAFIGAKEFMESIGSV